ncbi:MAG: flagellin lysine-N-methylase [Candidatus Scalindua sp.]
MHRDMTRESIEEEPALQLLLDGKENFTLKYMLQFKCTVSECEYTCCQSQKISISKSDYERLKERMNASNAEKDKFQSAVECVKDAEDPDSYAYFKLRSDGTCSYLSKDNLCTMHRDYGESMLCNTCTLYPRIVNKVGKRVELSALVSCPEITKMCLLADDATELVELDLKILPQEYSYTTVQLPHIDPFLNCINIVRYTVFKLLSLRQYSISVRLFSCVQFADWTSSSFYKNTTSFSEDDLFKKIARIDNPEILDELCNKYSTMVFPNSLGMSIVAPILTIHIKFRPETDLAQLALDCFKSYQAIGDVTGDGPIELLVSHEELWDAYEKRRSYWESSAFGERIDIYFTNYCRNFWINYLYCFSTDLLKYFRFMLVHYAVLRFLFFSNPELAALQKTLRDTSVEESIVSDTLNKIIVRTTYLFSKRIENNKTLVSQILQNMDERDIKTLAHMVFLVKF